RLAGAGLGQAHDVTALEQGRDGLALDRAGRLVAQCADDLDERVVQSQVVERGGFGGRDFGHHRFNPARTCRPASGSTMGSCAAATPSARREASTGVLRLRLASAIGPSSWWWAALPTWPTTLSPNRTS